MSASPRDSSVLKLLLAATVSASATRPASPASSDIAVTEAPSAPASPRSPGAPGSPASWADELAQTKTGEREQILPVAILDPQTQPWDPPGCEEGPGDDGRYAALVQIFDGVVGDLCTDYSTPVLEAAARIAAQCADVPG